MVEPINTDLPKSLTRAANKYGGTTTSDMFNAMYGRATPASRAALLNLDLGRINRGSDPYTATESAFGLAAASRNAPVTQEPEQSWFGRGINDLTTLVRGIPHLPGAIVSDVLDIPDALSQLPDAIAAGDSWAQSIGNVANLPAFRLLPGSFIAGAMGDDVHFDPKNSTSPVVAGGGWNQLAQHPLFTALDVLPFASKGAKLTRPYTRATEAAAEQARILNLPMPRAPRPIPTLIKNIGGRVDDVPDIRAAYIDQALARGQSPVSGIPERGFGAATPGTSIANPVPGPVLTPGPVGRATQRAGRAIGNTGIGRWTQDARSALARSAAERGLFHTSTILDPTRAALLDPEAARILHEVTPQLREQSKNIDNARMAEINNALVHDDAAVKATFTPEERAYIDTFTRAQTDLKAAQTAAGEQWFRGRSRRNASGARGLLEVEFPHGMETFDARTGSMIRDARYVRDRNQWFASTLNDITNNAPYTATNLVQDAAQLRRDTHLNNAQLRQAIKLIAYRYRTAGGLQDADTILTRLNKAQTRAHLDSILDGITRPTRTWAPTQVGWNWTRNLDAARANLAHIRGNDPKAAALYAALHPKNLERTSGIAAARAALTDMASRRVHGRPTFDIDNLRFELEHMDKVRRLDQDFGRVGVGSKDLAAAHKLVQSVEKHSVPARWDDLVRQEARAGLTSMIANLQAQGAVTPDIAARAIDAAAHGVIAEVEALIPGSEASINALLSDARESWLTLAQSGLEPQWVHRVNSAGARKLVNPRVFDSSSITPGQLKARLWDPTPSVPDLTISLHHQAYELLNAAASKNFADEMASWYGVSGAELQSRLFPIARQMNGRNPAKSTRAHLADLIDREWTAYDPSTFTRGKGSAPRQTNSSAQLYVPRSVAATLDRMRPTLPSTLERGLSKPMSVFRTTVLPLSPRWHLNNIIGGAIMLGSVANPRTATHLMEAYRLARGGGEELGRIESATGKAAMPPGMGLRDITEWARERKINDPTGVATAHSLAAGYTIGRILNSVRNNAAGQTVARGFGKVVDASYHANQFVDDMNRSLAFLTGQDNALRKGLSREEAIDAGINSARDALMSWDRLTPIERSGMRVVFPFYSWTSHLLRFVMQYPHDHPVRLAILARVADTELNDMQTGLPQRFASLFTPFGIDAAGNAMGVTIDSANPFRDVTNYGLLAGFVLGQEGGNISALTSGMNPYISTVMEAAGFDTFRGSPDLYPDLTYDPTTQQLTSSGGGSLPILALNNFIPQTEFLTSLAGMNRDFKQLARTNPDAAARQLRGAMGIPNLFRNFNVNEETIKAEIGRYNAFSKTRSEALATGNLDLLDRYPVLSAYRAQIESAAAAGELDPYMTSTNQTYQSATERVAAAYGQQAAGSGSGGPLQSVGATLGQLVGL